MLIIMILVLECGVFLFFFYIYLFFSSFILSILLFVHSVSCIILVLCVRARVNSSPESSFHIYTVDTRDDCVSGFFLLLLFLLYTHLIPILRFDLDGFPFAFDYFERPSIEWETLGESETDHFLPSQGTCCAIYETIFAVLKARNYAHTFKSYKSFVFEWKNTSRKKTSAQTSLLLMF